MKESLRLRLDQMVDRYEEVTALLSDPSVISDNNKFRELSVEHSDLMDITTLWQNYLNAETDQADAEAMLADATDPDMKEMMLDEIETARDTIIEMEEALNVMMLPKDPNDKQRFSLVICSVCIKNTRKPKAGLLKFYPRTKVNTAATKKSLLAYRVIASMDV